MTAALITKSGRNARESSRNAGEAMRNRQPMHNSNRTFRGEAIAPQPGRMVSSGRLYLHPEWAARLAGEEQVDYVVWSYATPIAWHTPEGWVVPPVKYSPTTTQHQHTARMGVHYSGERNALALQDDDE